MRFRCSSQVGSTLLLGLACLYSAPVPRTRRQSTADAAGDLLTCVGQPDPLYKHMPERRFLPASWQRIFNNLSKDASLSMHDILLCNVIIGSVRAVAETLDVTSTFYSTMPPDAKKAFGELYYKLLELQGDYSMALDELLLRLTHTTIQARSVTAAARAKRSGPTSTCNGVAFASRPSPTCTPTSSASRLRTPSSPLPRLPTRAAALPKMTTMPPTRALPRLLRRPRRSLPCDSAPSPWECVTRGLRRVCGVGRPARLALLC